MNFQSMQRSLDFFNVIMLNHPTSVQRSTKKQNLFLHLKFTFKIED